MFLVMIPFYWGSGETAIKAANKARKYAGERAKKSMPAKRIVFEYDAAKTQDVYVDAYGSLCWMGEEPVMVEKTIG